MSDVTDSGMRVSWNRPLQVNGELSDYVIKWSSDDDSGTDNTADTAYDIEDLWSCTEYTVTVAARNRAGAGEQSEGKTGTTLSAGENSRCR